MAFAYPTLHTEAPISHRLGRYSGRYAALLITSISLLLWSGLSMLAIRLI